MAALREIFAYFGVTFDDKPLQRGARSVDRMTRGITTMVRAAAGTFAIRGLGRFIRSTIDMGDELDKTSQQVGLTVDQLERLRYVGNLGGVASAEMANALGQLQRRADDAARGGAETSEAFRRLNVDVRDSQGNLRDAHDLFLAVAEGLHNLDNSSERTALSMELMGRQGRRMLPMFSDGAAGIERMEEEFTRLVGGSLQDFVNLSRDAQDDLTRLGVVTTSFRARLAVIFLPMIRNAVMRISQWAQSFRELAASSHIAEAALIAIGVATAGFALATIGTWGPLLLVIAAIALLALIVDDVWVAFEGGDSVLASFVDNLLKAVGSSMSFADIAQEIREEWKWLTEPASFMPGLRETIGQAVQVMSAFVGVNMSLHQAMQTSQAWIDGLASAMISFEESFSTALANMRAAIESFLSSFGALRPMVEGIGGRVLPGIGAIGGARRAAGASGAAGTALGPAVLEVATGTVASAVQGRPIDASSQLTVQITGGAYNTPEDLARAVSRGVRDEMDRHTRQIRAALVPGGSES